MYWEGFSPIGFVQVNSCVTVIEITLHTMSDVVIRLIILRVLALVKGFITSTDFLLLERQISWVITFITEEIYLFDTIIPQLDHMLEVPGRGFTDKLEIRKISVFCPSNPDSGNQFIGITATRLPASREYCEWRWLRPEHRATEAFPPE